MSELAEFQPAMPVTAPRRKGGGLAAVAWPVFGLVVAITGWWLATSVLQLIHPAALPPPQDVLAAFNARPGELIDGMTATSLETLVGFLLSTVAGVLIGVLLATSGVVERMFVPLLVAVNAVPKIAVGPLLVIAIGWGQKSILTMVFLLCFFPIVLSTTVGLTTTPADLAELGRSLDASRWQAFRKVRLPAALPQIFVGLKVAMPLAAIGAVIGEFHAGEGGVGFQILQYSGVGDSATVWAAISLIAIVSILLYFGLVLVERLLLPWVRETTSQR